MRSYFINSILGLATLATLGFSSLFVGSADALPGRGCPNFYAPTGTYSYSIVPGVGVNVNVQGWDNDNLALRGLSVYVNGKFYTNLPGQFVGMIGVGTGYVQFYSRGVNKCNVFDGTLKLVLAGTV